jgi:hypothetical protein
MWSYTSTPPYAFAAWCLVEHRDKFTFHLYLYKGNTYNIKRSHTYLTYLLTSPLRSHWNIGPQQLYNCWGFYSGYIFYRDRVASPVLQLPTWGSTNFSRLLRHAWATVGLFFSPVTTRGAHTHIWYNNYCWILHSKRHWRKSGVHLWRLTWESGWNLWDISPSLCPCPLPTHKHTQSKLHFHHRIGTVSFHNFVL